MLQHNSADAGRRAHLAHAAVMGLHALCCGLPALFMLAAAAGATSAITVAAGAFEGVHRFLHGHEGWILLISAGLVGIGGALELQARRARPAGVPWLFVFSACCFLANVAIIAIHRVAG